MDVVESPSPSVASEERRKPSNYSPTKKPLNVLGTQFMMTPPDTDGSSNASPFVESRICARSTSPALTTSSTLSSAHSDTSTPAKRSSSMMESGPDQLQASASGAPAVKRRRLTPAEKTEQQKDKEAKAVQRAEQRAIKEEEKREKDAEKRKKAEEREAKRREKELGEERKAQEKLKKERSQMRLGAFFQKHSTPINMDDSGAALPSPGDTGRRKSLSLEPFDAVRSLIRQLQSPTKCSSLQKAATGESTTTSDIRDYHKYFLPFQLQSHTSLAMRNMPDIESAQAVFDQAIAEKQTLGNSLQSLQRLFEEDRLCVRGVRLTAVRHILDHMQGASQQPIDLTREACDPTNSLRDVSRRYIEFHEDVRPAYFGSYSKVESPRANRQACRNPFIHIRKDTDYDYDSENEWEEPEDGDEELGDEDDEAESVGEADEMDEFLDDDTDALKAKRRLITGDLVPTSTGLCWADVSGKVVSSLASCDAAIDLRGMQMGILLPTMKGQAIDPFSTTYWEDGTRPAPSVTAVTAPAANAIPDSDLLAPPRQPLQPRINANGTLEHLLVGTSQGEKGRIAGVGASQPAKRGAKPAPRTLSTEDMEEFKGVVVNSTLSKADMLKGLKVRFPKLTNETIKATLGDHFAQLGASKADKKWVFVHAN